MLIAVQNTPTIATYEQHASILLAHINVFVMTVSVVPVKVVGTSMNAPLVYIIVSNIKSVVIILAVMVVTVKMVTDMLMVNVSMMTNVILVVTYVIHTQFASTT